MIYELKRTASFSLWFSAFVLFVLRLIREAYNVDGSELVAQFLSPFCIFFCGNNIAYMLQSTVGARQLSVNVCTLRIEHSLVDLNASNCKRHPEFNSDTTRVMFHYVGLYMFQHYVKYHWGNPQSFLCLYISLIPALSAYFGGVPFHSFISSCRLDTIHTAWRLQRKNEINFMLNRIHLARFVCHFSECVICAGTLRSAKCLV